MEITKEELESLRKNLKYGDNKLIAKQTKKSPTYVSYVLNSIYYNEDVIKAAIKLANQHIMDRKELKDGINQIGDGVAPIDI